MNPQRAILVCATARTGSGLLCSALWGTELCGRPDEYFGPSTRKRYEERWGCVGDDAYRARMVEYATTPNGVLSAKIHWRHMAFLRALLGDGTPGGEELPRDALLRLAPRLDFCWVSRRNKVRQAVSLLRARAGSGFLWRGDTSRPPARDIEFDTAAIRRLVEEIEEGEAHWGEWFRQREIVPCRVWYEDDLEHDFAQTVLRLLGRLAIDAPPDLVVRSNLRKQSDELSEQLVQQYLQASRA